MNIYQQIIASAQAQAAELTALRRDFHKYAESGWLEMRTSSIIARRLTDLGYEVLTGEDVCLKESRMGVPSQKTLDEAYERAIAQGADPEFVEATKDGMTGVIGILHCGEGPVLAMRFDIDALGVIESEDPDHFPYTQGFASVNHGAMHACGHDAHTAILLGSCKILYDMKDGLDVNVKFLFQPAEETVGGAELLIKDGCMENPKVDYTIGLHVMPHINTGMVELQAFKTMR